MTEAGFLHWLFVDDRNWLIICSINYLLALPISLIAGLINL